MSILTSTVPKAIVPGLRKLIVDGIRMIPDYVGLITSSVSSNQAREIHQDYADPQPFEDVGEGGDTPYGTSINGYTTTFTHTTYKGGMKVTEEAFDDSLYLNAPAKRRAQAIGKRFIEKRNKVFFNIFNKAFNTAFTSYGDAKPLISSVHPVPDGSFTQSNASTTGELLSPTAIQNSLLRMQQLKDFAGELEARSNGPFIILAPPALRQTVMEDLQSERVAGEFSNTINVLFGKKVMNVALKVPNNDYLFSTRYNMGFLICPYISTAAGGSDTAWFILEQDNNGLIFYNRKGLEIEENIDFDTDVLKMKGKARFSQGWDTWKGVDGSKGDGLAYAS